MIHKMIRNVFSQIDDLVNVIPGGWATIAVFAVGAYAYQAAAGGSGAALTGNAVVPGLANASGLGQAAAVGQGALLPAAAPVVGTGTVLAPTASATLSSGAGNALVTGGADPTFWGKAWEGTKAVGGWAADTAKHPVVAGAMIASAFSPDPVSAADEEIKLSKYRADNAGDISKALNYKDRTYGYKG